MGYDHILAYDHVLGADADYYGNWTGAYRLEDQFHEPFVLFGFLAGLTKTIEFTTGIIIPAAASDGVGGEAGGGAGRAERREAAPGHRHRLELCGVRGVGREF